MNINTKKISRVSVVTNGSNSQKPKSTTTQSKETITQPQKQFFQKDLCLLEKYCGLEQLPKGKIEYDKKIWEGGFGIIVKGTLQPKHHKPINIVIKKPKLQGADKRTKEQTKQALESETDISSNIIKTAKQNFDINNNLISSQEGLANISLQQKATYNRHIQKYIHGQNGFDAIHNKKLDLYNTQTGHPKNIKQSLMLAQQLLNAIHALHEQGVAHCDIKPRNIMLEMTDNNPKLTIIDLGGAAKFGQQTTIISKNAAPETQIAWQMYNRLATSSEDIYATGTVLCELLFGKNNKKWTQIFFKPNNIQNMQAVYQIVNTIQTVPVLVGQYYIQELGQLVNAIQYMQVAVQRRIPTVITKKLDTGYYPDQEQPETYLRNLLQEANRLSDVENLYPPAIYNAIEDLIVRMCAIEPNDRPSTQYCLAVLNDLALCDHDAICNDTTGKIKPMVVGTTLQAIQLISDLNELNKKAELTPKEKETREVLIYNLGRDFEIESEKNKKEISDAISIVGSGGTLNEGQVTQLKQIDNTIRSRKSEKPRRI